MPKNDQDKVSMLQSRCWVQGQAADARIRWHGKTTNRRDMNPIAWVKNVKVSSWDSDSLAEETTQAGPNLPKLTSKWLMFYAGELGYPPGPMDIG